MTSQDQQHSNVSPSGACRPAIINPEPNMQGEGFPYPLEARAPDGTPLVGSWSAKKKRGRPRKYSPDINISLGHSGQYSAGETSAGPSDRPLKKNRGRPPGGSRGVGFTPHVITAKAGEDVASKIYAFSQEGPRTVCILSANGAIGNATLSQPTSESGAVTYEGRYEIISLSGSLFCDNNGDHSRSGGLNVTFANSEGQVIGGGVVGVLRAAGPVQVIVGSFIVDDKKSSSSAPKSGKKSSSSAPKSAPSSAPSPQMLNLSSPLSFNSTSQGGSSDLSGKNASSPTNRGPNIRHG